MRTDAIRAEKSTPCAVCTQEIQSGDMIVKHSGGMYVPIRDHGTHWMPSTWAHAGCIPEAAFTAPHLTRTQISALLSLVNRIMIPSELDMATRRLTGAARTARYNRRPEKQELPILALGPDLYQAYVAVLNRATTKGHAIGEWHQPKAFDGQVWREPKILPPPDRSQLPHVPQAELSGTTRHESMLQQGLVTAPVVNRFEDGPQNFWQVRGPKKWPVECEGYTACSGYASVRDTPAEPYVLVEWYLIHETAANADDDIQRWLAEKAIKEGLARG